MAGGGSSKVGLIDRIFGPREMSGSEETHVACGCSPHLSACGTFNPEATGVEVEYEPEAVTWCHDCKQSWDREGCRRCGQCRPGALCFLCLGI